MVGKLILWLSAVVFIAYGLVSLLSPDIPAGYAGLAMTNGNAFAEISSMYGGLQTGIGLFCLIAAVRPEYYRPGLLLLFIGIGALAFARMTGWLSNPEPVTFYTYGALIYELITATVAAFAFWQSRAGHA